MPGGVDLHTHTTASDGTYAPRELVAEAASRGPDVDAAAGVPGLLNDLLSARRLSADTSPAAPAHRLAIASHADPDGLPERFTFLIEVYSGLRGKPWQRWSIGTGSGRCWSKPPSLSRCCRPRIMRPSTFRARSAFRSRYTIARRPGSSIPAGPSSSTATTTSET